MFILQQIVLLTQHLPAVAEVLATPAASCPGLQADPVACAATYLRSAHFRASRKELLLISSKPLLQLPRVGTSNCGPS